MSSRRISDKGVALPDNPHFLEFERSDGDSRTWPSNTTQIVDGDGHVNFMQYVEIDALAAIKWRRGAGKGAATALELPGVSCESYLRSTCSVRSIASGSRLHSQILARKLPSFRSPQRPG
jgi:hypothetical protein